VSSEDDHQHDENCDHDHAEGGHEGHDHGPAVDPAVYEGLEGWKVQETSQATRDLIACVPWERYLALQAKAVKKIGKQITVPGFRKGKVPPARVLALHGDDVRRETQDELVQSVWEEAREKEKIRPVGNPSVVDLQFTEGEPIRFVARFEVLPEIELTGLAELKVDDKIVKVTDADVEEEIQRLREARSEIVDSAKEETAPGDLALATLYRYAPGADPASDEPEETSEDVLIEVGSERNPPELDKALLGLGVGEMRVFTNSVIGEGEEKQEVPGRVLLKGVKERSLPEVNDDFIKGLGLGPETVDAMKAEIRDRLVTGRSDKARAEQDDQAVKHLLERNPLEMPKALVEHEAESRIRRGMENLSRQGVDLKTIDVDWASEFERARKAAEEALRADYLLELAADASSIEVTDEDLATALDEEAKRLGNSAKQLRAEIIKSDRMNEFRQTVRRRLTLDKLRAGATVSVE